MCVSVLVFMRFNFKRFFPADEKPQKPQSTGKFSILPNTQKTEIWKEVIINKKVCAFNSSIDKNKLLFIVK